MKPLLLTNAVVVVTGATRGIGLATAQAFATAGAIVYTGDLDAPTTPDNPTSLSNPPPHPTTAQSPDNTRATPARPHPAPSPTDPRPDPPSPGTPSPHDASSPHPGAFPDPTNYSPHPRAASADPTALRPGTHSTDCAEFSSGCIHGPWFLDVTSRDSFLSFVDNVIADSGRIDILVNNAGVMPLGRFLDEPDELSRTTLDVNVWGLIHGMRLVLPSMIARGNGHVVNIASMAGKIPFPGMAVYNASKYAAVGLTAAVRRELHGTGVTASAVLPGAVRTSLSSGVRLGGLLPTVDPEDVAAAVLRTCRTQQAELTVPRWLGGWKVLDGLVPASAMALARRLAGDDRGLTVDDAARRAYNARLATFSRTREA
ncbi:SDR family NAD(P)-dependent oxidoreductase [Kribbella sp. NPDC050820]|uniref:SDR family oxidoreductase n=1 Tax=Kribbella sp. NPDC050820 TaxID=3155408 RepID=UPI0033CDB722